LTARTMRPTAGHRFGMAASPMTRSTTRIATRAVCWHTSAPQPAQITCFEVCELQAGLANLTIHATRTPVVLAAVVGGIFDGTQGYRRCRALGMVRLSRQSTRRGALRSCMAVAALWLPTLQELSAKMVSGAIFKTPTTASACPLPTIAAQRQLHNLLPAGNTHAQTTTGRESRSGYMPNAAEKQAARSAGIRGVEPTAILSGNCILPAPCQCPTQPATTAATAPRSLSNSIACIL